MVAAGWTILSCSKASWSGGSDCFLLSLASDSHQLHDSARQAVQERRDQTLPKQAKSAGKASTVGWGVAARTRVRQGDPEGGHVSRGTSAAWSSQSNLLLPLLVLLSPLLNLLPLPLLLLLLQLLLLRRRLLLLLHSLRVEPGAGQVCRTSGQSPSLRAQPHLCSNGPEVSLRLLGEGGGVGPPRLLLRRLLGGLVSGGLGLLYRGTQLLDLAFQLVHAGAELVLVVLHR